ATAARLRSDRTYRARPASSYGSVDDAAMGSAIVRSVDETPEKKGYRQEASRPDFLVKWHVSVESRPQSTPMATPTFRDVGPMPPAGRHGVPEMWTRQCRGGTRLLHSVETGPCTALR